MSLNVHEQIDEICRRMGSQLSIVAHHYQNDAIVRHSVLTGDSLELARKGKDIQSENIVFCGVNFMAESSALLARPGQKVFLPAMDANCVMARMIPAGLLDSVITTLQQRGIKAIPLAYVNTSVSVKSVVGKHGGAVCTSANAKRMMEWAFEQGDMVLFLPDKNLGTNTARQCGLTDEEIRLLDIRTSGENIGPLDPKIKLLLWPGRCAIHARLHIDDINDLRKEHPGILIAVHPECAPELVEASDASGSTSFLIKYAENAPDGATLGIGTEINLVKRLAKRHAGRLTVLPLFESACSDMAKTRPEVLLKCLQRLENGDSTLEPVTVDQQAAPDARLALTRMLEACS